MTNAKPTQREEIDIVAVLFAPLPVSQFVRALKALQDKNIETLYVRNCADGYEVFRYRPKPP
jgi:hypothetical protein